MPNKFLRMKIKELVNLKDKESIFRFFNDRINTYNDELNAFTEIIPDPDRTSGEGPLNGIPYALKDNILARGTKTTCGSKILSNYKSVYDATVTKRLRDSGAILMGKTNMDEFAMGSSTEFSAFGPSKNPWDANRVPGGSSGGSAAAVAAGLVPFALGSDTGGSIRQPAAFCGVVGYKPSYGLVSRYGLVAFASSLDQIGPITRCVDDAVEVAKVIIGFDPDDSTTIEHPLNFENEEPKDLTGLKFALPGEMIEYPGLQESVKEVFMKMVESIEKAGGIVEKVSIPSLKYVVATYYLIAPGEASSNLSRYDGIRYGQRKDADRYEEVVNQSRDFGFGDEVKRRILLGTFTLSAAYYDAYYRKALRVRKLISKEINEILSKYDFVINPTSPIVAPKIGEISDPLTYYLMDIYTIPANLAGLPAISLPAGAYEGLPVGFQMMARRFEDVRMLNTARILEKLSPSYDENGLARIAERWY
ncbi:MULTISPECIES: Asp-tRNA(Asn)/Glu-tRNA(Gln) amidotransferase subunit GatA [unclassified Kosmotoga]|uniref:Asp-tRNA(Asn)/Glu-tRNA(Gln) amidotransferase subunit GatA n=2 Tax=unclassified Kosmotoga TaxID=2631489 RepID=UPI000ADABB3A|nr:Asp-tRNA(Asn)/Glu-tRNA(Gln) amidotransferase subunit GatA [Kosmotoga sp. DU53]MDI3524019.1 aspartyl-tRNA(Asn)/glutamyl-tRNA(Gln) amidotransferase subunit [Kosmotoga sp.]